MNIVRFLMCSVPRHLNVLADRVLRRTGFSFVEQRVPSRSKAQKIRPQNHYPRP
jgi:hypothetical protein